MTTTSKLEQTSRKVLRNTTNYNAAVSTRIVLHHVVLLLRSPPSASPIFFIETFKIKFPQGQWLLGPTWHYELMLVMIPSAVLLSKGFKTRSRCARNCSSSDPWSNPFSCLHLRPSLQSCRREAASFHHRDLLRNEKLFSAVLLVSGRLPEHLPVEG